MAISTFGVTYTTVHDHHFPQVPGNFSTASNPTAATVTSMIEAEAARLHGKLVADGVSPVTIQDGAADYPAAYAWCADTVRMGAAIRAMRAMTNQSPDLVDNMREELEARYEDLDTRGYVVLGDAPAPANNANGPRSHILEHDLDTGSDTDISDVATRFRRSDVL